MKNTFGPDRQSIRLKNYDYTSEGLYYVTLCTQNRKMLFGDIRGGEMHKSEIGDMVQNAWKNLPHYDSRISLDEFQIMPDHFHGIIVIDGDFSRMSPNCNGGGDFNGGRGSHGGRGHMAGGGGTPPLRGPYLIRFIGLNHGRLINTKCQFQTMVMSPRVFAYGNEDITSTSSEMRRT